MIRYDLQCDNGHEFDGWFRDSAAFDSQRERQLVSCSHCGSTNVEKQLMMPGIPAKSNKREQAPTRVAAGPIDPAAAKMMDMMRAFRKAVEENSDYVGERFAEEARKIHYKEADLRGIYGEATPEDTRELLEEGIEIFPLPRLPEDGN